MKQYGDIAGDGGSDVLGQVIAQRKAMRESLASVRHVVAIASGKGGVGKSTMTLALASSLRDRGQDVAILDCDVSGPCQAQLAGLSGVPWIPEDEGLRMPRREDGLGVVSFGGILGADQPMLHESVAHGDEHTWRATREMAMLGQLITAVHWGDLDVLLVDLPPGADRTVHHLELLGPSAKVVLVTLPSALATGVVARSLAAVREAGVEPLGYIQNMAGYWCRDCGVIRPLFPDGNQDLDVPCLGSVPFDPGLARRCDDGWPTRTKDVATEDVTDPSSTAIEAVALALMTALEESNR
ncbi:MAG: Mrp/NBP35 family ATP-binding protein [Thermoanaerobaculia bacterium]|nr:Mrp/NBP35 family ATP-binding protein [Thermoanaerobaculia bacterium]